MSDSTSLPPPQTHAQEPQAPGLPELVLASSWQRLFAAMIDVGVLLVALTFVEFLMDELWGWPQVRPSGLADFVLIAILRSGGLIGVLVLQGYLLLTRGQSLGKMILKMRVLRADGSWVPGKKMLDRGMLLFVLCLQIWGLKAHILSERFLSEDLEIQILQISYFGVLLWAFIWWVRGKYDERHGTIVVKT